MEEQAGISEIDELLPTLTPEAKALYAQALIPGWIASTSAYDRDRNVAQEQGSQAQAGQPDARTLLGTLGLLTPDLADRSRLRPVDPQVVASSARRRLNLLIARLEEHGDSLARELAVLSSFYDQMEGEHPSVPLEELNGLKTINEAIEEAAGTCSEEVLTAQPGSRSRQALEQALKRAEPVLTRGVRMRTLYQHPARFSEATKEYVTSATRLGAEVRTMDEIPSRLMVFDRRTALLSASQDRQYAVLIRHPAVVCFLVEAFERDWGRASPYGTGYQVQEPGRKLNMVQEAIMRLLIEGVSDDAIARRMNLNVRTCRAHIAKILKAYGAQSRVQAAYLMGRSEAGLPPHEPPSR